MSLNAAISNIFDQTTIFKAEVVDVITDLNIWSQQKINETYGKLNDRNKPLFVFNLKQESNFLYLRAPAKSCILRLKYKNIDTLLVAYPFFSSHFSLPLKIGETAWCYVHEEDSLIEAYWLSRVHGTDITEDLNATDALREEIKDNLFSNSKSFKLEPVPRLNFRDGDTVLQGSHNSAIILSSSPGDVNNTKNEVLPLQGSVDIVVGRGRFEKDNTHQPNKLFKDRSDKIDLGGNKFQIIKIDENYELNKDPLDITFEYRPKLQKQNNDINKNKLLSDYINDSSRLYLSMNCNPDKEFNLSSMTSNFKSINPNDGDNNGYVLEDVDNTSAMVLKTDDIRIIARKNEDYNVNGNIRIIKEGNDNDRSIIALQSDGTVLIDGSKIIIGSNNLSNNGEGNQVVIGLNATEPIVLGNKLREKLENFMDAVTEAFDYAAFHVHPTGTGPSGPPTGQLWTTKSNNIKKTKRELKETLSRIAKTQ